jgi:hypothetical protein
MGECSEMMPEQFAVRLFRVAKSDPRVINETETRRVGEVRLRRSCLA